MGQAVIHFEILGQDPDTLKTFYSSLFNWQINSDNPMNYGVVPREGNTNADGVGIGGGLGATMDGGKGHITFYVEVPDVEAALAQAESLGGTRLFGPDEVPGTGVVLGQFSDPEGHVVGLMKATS
jgi:uncharacterized protein